MDTGTANALIAKIRTAGDIPMIKEAIFNFKIENPEIIDDDTFRVIVAALDQANTLAEKQT